MSWLQLIGEGLNMAATNAGLQFGMDRQAGYNKKLLRKNWQYQKLFAKHSLGWRVQDAINAGLHPLAALGASTGSFAPISVGSNQQGGFEKMGQATGQGLRNMMKILGKNKEMEQIQLEQEVETLRNMRLKNDNLERLKGAEVPTNKVSSDGIWESNTSDMSGSNQSLYSSPNVPYKERVGTSGVVQAGRVAEENVTVTKGGWVKFLPSQTTQEVYSEGPAQWPYWIGKGVTWAARREIHTTRLGRDSKLGFKSRSAIRKIRPKAPKGYEYRYDIRAGMLRQQKKTKKVPTSFYTVESNVGFYSY